MTGAAAARWLVPDHDVRLLEQSQVAGVATGHASGLVSIAADYAEHPDLARFAIAFFDAYDGTGPFAYTRRPNVGLQTTEEATPARTEAGRLADAGIDFNLQYISEDPTDIGP